MANDRSRVFGSCLMPRYVIITPTLFTERDWSRFGCNELIAAGYDMYAIEAGPALGLPDTLYARAGRASTRLARRPATVGELEELISEIKDNDIVLVEARLSPATRSLFALLTRYHVS